MVFTPNTPRQDPLERLRLRFHGPQFLDTPIEGEGLPDPNAPNYTPNLRRDPVWGPIEHPNDPYRPQRPQGGGAGTDPLGFDPRTTIPGYFGGGDFGRDTSRPLGGGAHPLSTSDMGPTFDQRLAARRGRPDFEGTFGGGHEGLSLSGDRLVGTGGVFDDARAAQRRPWPTGEQEDPTGWDALSPKQKMAMGMDIGRAGGGMVAGLINMFRGSPHALIDAYKKLSSAYENLQDPNILKQVWDAPWLKQIAQFFPQAVQGMNETMADFEGYEGDPALRAQEDLAQGSIVARAQRGDPEGQRIQTREAAAGVGRALARAGTSAQEAAARRGMPGGGVPGMAQASADYAAKVGSSNVLASRRSREQAEALALQGAMGIRKGRESQGQMAANLRNNFRNAMSNRQLSVAITNQRARQASSDQNQRLQQSLHERNVTAADRRRRENQMQQNVWEREDYDRDRQRLVDRGSLEIGIARERDQAHRDRSGALGKVLGGAGQIAGAVYGGGFGRGDDDDGGGGPGIPFLRRFLG